MNREYTHGFTQRSWLDTDKKRVEKINEYLENQEPAGGDTAHYYAHSILTNLRQQFAKYTN